MLFGNLRSFIAAPGLRLASWNKQRSDERTEGERLFEESDYAGAELHLAQAILDSERRQDSADQRILLRLELAEAQRKQYHAYGDQKKLADAEESIREAHDLASRTHDRELTVQTVDAAITIAADRGDLEEVERLMQEVGALEAKGKRRDLMQLAPLVCAPGLGLVAAASTGNWRQVWRNRSPRWSVLPFMSGLWARAMFRLRTGSAIWARCITP